MKNKPYWLETPLSKGHKVQPIANNEIAVIGSGLAGASVAYWLEKAGYQATIIDYEPEKSASYRNAGHILWGSGESYKAMVATYGREGAKKIMNLSSFCSAQIYDTIRELEIDCDYRKTGAMSFAIDETEAKDLKDSVEMMNEDGFGDRYFCTQSDVFRELMDFGIKDDHYQLCFKAATAHPVKFRNHLIDLHEYMGGLYHERKIDKIEEVGDVVKIHYDGKVAEFDAVVLCTNAYSPLVSDFYASRKTIEPYRGQILVSKPIKDLKVSGAHSFDHGYIYANGLPDNRLLIGGWRNNVEGGEVGSYELSTNPSITEGLKDFVKNHYNLPDIEWEYEWSGIMGATNSGLPYVGQTNSPRVFSCAGFTGYGFGWAHGCAKLLVDIMDGRPLVDGWELLRP